MTLVSPPIKSMYSNPSQRVRGNVLARGKPVYSCVGERLPIDRKSLALAETRLIIAKMLWNFDMKCQTNEDWLYQSSYMLWKKKPLMMKLVSVRSKPDHLA